MPLFLCEDHRLRWHAGLASSVKRSMASIALQVAQEAGCLPLHDYNRITALLALAGHNFTSINCEVLLQIAERNNWHPEGEFVWACLLLSCPTLELESLLGVAADFASALEHLGQTPKTESFNYCTAQWHNSRQGEYSVPPAPSPAVAWPAAKNKSYERHLHIRSAFQNCIRRWAKDNNIGLV